MSDLFTGTARYYSRYRPGYPDAVLGRLRSAFGLDGSGRLLDLGCGTGELARALHQDFEGVIGLDLSPEMLAEAQRQAEAAGIRTVRWRCQAAEDIGAELGRFRLVTIGNAFHWMSQDEVIDRAYALLDGGGVAILGNPGGLWGGEDVWEQAVREVLVRWLGPRRLTRAGPFVAEAGAERRTLARSRFVGLRRGEYRWSRLVDPDTIVGELYSTSYASQALLGERAAGFETDVRRALAALSPSGQFVQRLRTEYLIGYKR